jgi:hypothetical protein
MKRILLIVAMALLAGCGATTGTNARSSISTFDGARVVSIDPHGTNCGMSMVCSLLGAQWSSNQPDRVQLVVSTMGEYASIQMAGLNIDGTIIPLADSAQLTQYTQSMSQTPETYNVAAAQLGRTSTRSFIAPLALVDRILAARSVKMRVQTDGVTIDSIIFEGDKDSKAHHALERFIAQVRSAPAA